VPIVCWRGSADIVEKFVKKGDRIGVAGMIQTRNYEAQDGTKRYITEIVADEVELLGNKRDGAVPLPPEPPASGSAQKQAEEAPQDFTAVDDDTMPF